MAEISCRMCRRGAHPWEENCGSSPAERSRRPRDHSLENFRAVLRDKTCPHHRGRVWAAAGLLVLLAEARRIHKLVVGIALTLAVTLSFSTHWFGFAALLLGILRRFYSSVPRGHRDLLPRWATDDRWFPSSVRVRPRNSHQMLLIHPARSRRRSQIRE